MIQKIKFTSEDTLSQQCYEQLQQEIVDGVLKPGQKIKIASLKERFSVGQSPIREALCRLSSFGLVQVVGNRGFKVAAISESDIRDTYDVFTRVENMALALAIEKGEEQWEASIVAQLHRLSLIENKKGFDSYAQWAEHNYNFHVALISGCNSPTLLEIRRNVYAKFDRYCRMAYQLSKHALSLNNQEHVKLAEYVIKRDVVAAQKMMTYHINGAIEDVIEKFKKNSLV